MKKIYLCLLIIFGLINIAYAGNLPDTKHKNIGNKDKISYNASTDTWSRKIDKKSGNYFVKTKGFGDFFDYNDSNGNFAFSTDCEYEFIDNNNLIGYSNKNMKFYYITYINGGISKKELSKEEVENLFPEYKVISLSEFSENTNAIKIKKHMGNLKILLYNDTDNTYNNYKFSSGNAKFEQYSLRGFINISDQGMIQFSSGETSDKNPMFVLLIR